MKQFILAGATMLIIACTQQTGGQQAHGGANDAAKTVVGHPPDVSGWPIVDRKGKQMGMVTTRLSHRGVLVSLDTFGLPPGVHGVHIHEVPKCDLPDFGSAGAHWNWTHKKHGHKSPQGYHAGDLGNLTVGADGKARATFVVAANDWDPKLLGGLPIIIHAAADDEKTDPSGNSGARIACGVLYLRRD